MLQRDGTVLANDVEEKAAESCAYQKLVRSTSSAGISKSRTNTSTEQRCVGCWSLCPRKWTSGTHAELWHASVDHVRSGALLALEEKQGSPDPDSPSSTVLAACERRLCCHVLLCCLVADEDVMLDAPTLAGLHTVYTKLLHL